MDGKWNSGLGQETNRQAELSRHRLLRVGLSTTGLVLPGDASGYAGTIPTSIPTIDGGPHFVMSSRTPDNSHAYGFEFCITNRNFSTQSGTAPFEITVWELIGNTIIADQNAPFIPVWASFLPVTGVNYNELYHSFDCNATALRFEIDDAAADQTVARSVMIAFCEL